LSGSHTPRALAAKAVNVLHFEESAWLGDNTDGAGWRIDVEQRHGLCLAHKSVLILGAGGAVQGLLPILLEAGVASIDIRNRNQLRAQALCTEYGDERLQAGARLQRYDLVINGTAAGHHANSQEVQNPMLAFDAAWIDGDTIAYDLSYGPAAASFLHLAQEAGAKVIDGFGMLIEQAALAFARWHGLNPNAEAAYQELRR
jgi:shikimate dehydrogenase